MAFKFILASLGCVITIIASGSLHAQESTTTVAGFVQLVTTPPGQCRVNPQAARPNTIAINTATSERLTKLLETRFPKVLDDETAIEQQVISAAELKALMRHLSCVASWNGDVFVLDTAATLMGSKRHGAASFAILQAMAHDRKLSPSERASALSFSQRMRSALAPK